MFFLMKVEIQYTMSKLTHILLFLFIPLLGWPQKREFRELYAFYQINQGNYGRALDSIDLLLNQYQSNDLVLAKANILYKLKSYEQALLLANEINKSSHGFATQLQLKIYLDRDDYKSAKEALIHNIKSNYKMSLFDLLNHPDYNKLTGSSLMDSVLKTNLYSATEKQLYQAEKLYRSKRFSQAEFILDQMIKRNDQLAEAYYLKSLIESQKDFYTNALKLINTAIILQPSNTEFYVQRTDLLIKLKQYKQAQYDIDKLLKIKPADLNVYGLKAKVSLMNKEYEEVVLLTDQLFDLELKNQDLLYANSKANYELGNQMQALKSVNELLTKESSKEAFELRGDIYMKTKTFEFAAQDYSMFLDMEPYNGNIYNKKGLARYNMGDREGACSDWKKAKRYGSYDAVKNLEKFCK